jgi:neural cell adhesion molecule
VACYYVNRCGLLMCICVNCCGKTPPETEAKAKEIAMEEGRGGAGTVEEKQPLNDEKKVSEMSDVTPMLQ